METATAMKTAAAKAAASPGCVRHQHGDRRGREQGDHRFA
jgi:hypothetical protein